MGLAVSTLPSSGFHRATLWLEPFVTVEIPDNRKLQEMKNVDWQVKFRAVACFLTPAALSNQTV